MLGQSRPGTGRGCDLGQRLFDQLGGDGGINNMRRREDRRPLIRTLDRSAGRGEPAVATPAARASGVGALDRQAAVRARACRGVQDSSAPRIVARVGRFLLPDADGLTRPAVPVLRPRRDEEAT